jgi:hypothetical protein
LGLRAIDDFAVHHGSHAYDYVYYIVHKAEIGIQAFENRPLEEAAAKRYPCVSGSLGINECRVCRNELVDQLN